MGDHPLRAFHPTLLAANRAVTAQRDAMLTQWMTWLGERITGTPTTPRELVAAEFGLVLDTFATLVGPLRRETKAVWNQVTEFYGRHAASRGLAAGEVVEEMQYLRELLIRFLAPEIAQLRPRQGMALLLRLNRLVDRGVTMAVIGYTNALVATLLPSNEDGASPSFDDHAAIRTRLDAMRTDLERIDRVEVTH
jgi:hypothetical protein